MRKIFKKIIGSGLLASCLIISAVHAADLRIGYKSEVTAADPHVLNGANRNIWNHVYESLVSTDAHLRPKPGLALSWKLLSPKLWEFRLRPNVRFHNGALMTAEDVRYSLNRALQLSGPRTYRSYLKEVESISVTGPLVIQVKTKQVSPTLPENIGLVSIIPQSLHDNVAEDDFASGKAAIGTGPYKFAKWEHGQKITLIRNPDYWGDKEPWDNVTFQFIPREPARAAALLSGSLDLINDVTANMEESLKDHPLASTTSYMLMYLSLDQYRDNSPYIRSTDGKPLNKNPFKNLKVRQAIMTGINRSGIIKFLMKTDATATEQLVPQGFFGYDAGVKSSAYDLAKAKALLSEGGYPNGFQLTLHCSNNRYINDAKLCEAIGQMLTQMGIKTDVVALPFSTFLTRLIGGGANGEPEFSATLQGTGAVTGDSLSLLTALIHSSNKSSGFGANNFGRYSNPAIDALIDKALASTDDKVREDLQKKAAQAALQDVAVIPVLHTNVSWAMKRDLSISPRADGFTMATDIRRK